jgi:superfamily II DNA or RNA helicase
MTAAATPQPNQRPLRRWQAEALETHRTHPGRDFLVTATPGAGKTSFALTLATELLTKRIVERIIVVCPTDHLRRQWADAAEKFGLILDPSLTNADGPIRAGTHGYVATYAQIAARPQIHAARTQERAVLAIFDELHHAGDGQTWGEAVLVAFDGAVRRLGLTGTPFRTDAAEQIPFVTYDKDSEGALVSHSDYTYGYREALADQVVRPIVFAAYSGQTRWRNSAGAVLSASLSGENSQRIEAEAWRTALDPDGQWVPHVIAAADERLTQQRANGIPDAAGLILASDQDSARAYAEVVTRITGTEPALIISDDPEASDKLEAFPQAGQRWLVCVRMVSEGVDKSALLTLVYLTSYRTPLFFTQAVGRVVRARTPTESATVFLPAVRPLLALAAEVESERNHVIPAPAASDDFDRDDDLDPPLPELPEGAREGEWAPLAAEASFAHVLSSGRAVTADLTGEDTDFLGLPGLLTAEQTAQLLARRDEQHRLRAVSTSKRGGPAADPGPDDGPVVETMTWREMKALRSELATLVNRFAARTNTPHPIVHSKLRAAVPGPPTANATSDILVRRRDEVLAWLS